MLKWYYDPKTKSCARFWYGGCGGNENRFDTQKECDKFCVPGKKHMPGWIGVSQVPGISSLVQGCGELACGAQDSVASPGN